MIEVGDRVDYHSIVDGPITSKNHTVKRIEKQPNNFGCGIAWISDKSECVVMAALSLNDDYMKEVEAAAYCPHGFLAGCPKC